MRTWLFIPADSERKLARGLEAGADMVILDLEDSVAACAKNQARANALAVLKERAGGRHAGRSPAIFVRVNGLAGPHCEQDLEAVLPGAPDGILLPKAGGGRDVARLDARLTAGEALCGIPEGATAIAAIATETAASLFALGSYAGASPRLAALTWGAEDLSAELGARAVFDESGGLTAPYVLARALCLAGAVAAGAAPIDGIYAAFADEEGLRTECAAAARDGFTGKLAIHPAQVPVINAAFTPSAAEIEHARAVIAAFDAAGRPGTIGFEGKMLDLPHLKRAEKLLGRAAVAAASKAGTRK